MPSATPKPITSRPAIVIAALAALAVVGFLLVNRLVNRFAEQQKALARHLYAEGLTDLQAGHPDRAIEEFRAALIYSRDNFDYQLNLARALRDTGRTAESATYLISLWERSPQNAAVNLALGRLAARESQTDKAIQYYHNAIYGVWATDADTRRQNAWFELIDFLLRQNAFPQAQAELITLAAELPRTSELHLRVAGLFTRAQDYEHAWTEYQRVLQRNRASAPALFGAGDAAFHLGRYRTAERYLRSAAEADPQNTQAAQMLDLVKLTLDSDPFVQRIPIAERDRRARAAFLQAGERLDDCIALIGAKQTASPSTPPSQPSIALASLKTQWAAMKPKLYHLRSGREADVLDSLMDLVFQIEQQTLAACGSPSDLDQALLLLAQNPGGVDQ